MPIKQDTFNLRLYDFLKSWGYRPVPIDSKGQNAPVPQEADVFKFTFTKNNKEIGDVWVTVDQAQKVIVYFDDEVANSDDSNTSSDKEFNDSWTGFLHSLKNWAFRKQLKFEPKNKDHLAADMAQREHMKKKENVLEGYHPMGKKASYNDAIPQVKIILQHNRQIEEGEQRFRNIAKIFVENIDGERFLLPTKRPGIAKVYARHIAEGGTPYDDKAKHITILVEEYTKMAGFVRATKNGQFNESAQKLVTLGQNHYQNLRETLTRMISKKGYSKYFESYTPILNEEQVENNLTELFVEETLDPRIESVMPILSKLSKNLVEMEEVKELDEWAEQIVKEKLDIAEIDNDPEKKNLSEAQGRYQLIRGDSVVGVYDNMPDAKSMYNKFSKTTRGEDWSIYDTQQKVVRLSTNRDFLDRDIYGQVPGLSKRDDATAKVSADWKQKKQQGNSEKDVEDFFNIYGRLGGLALEENFMPKVYFVVEKGTNKVVGTWDGEAFKPFDRTKFSAGTMDMVPGGYEIDKLSGPMAPQDIDKVKAINEKQSNIEEGPADEPVEPDMDADDKRWDDAEDIEEDLDSNQKRVGQLGPTEKVGPKGAVGKLVGASESVELDQLKALSGIK